MSEISKYNIAFKGLALGSHEYEYNIGKSFFDCFNGGIVDDGEVLVKVLLDKQSNLLTLKFNVGGYVAVSCDRCLDTFNKRIENEAKVFVKYGEDTYEEGDDVIWVDVNEHQINIAQMIYDYVLLALPIRLVHPDDNGKSLCNQDMIDKLEALNSSSVDEEAETTDSRWDELKKIIKTDKN